MNKSAILSLLLLPAVMLSAQVESSSEEVIIEDGAIISQEENKVVITITENGETYTIEAPDMESLGNFSNLEGLETLKYIEEVEGGENLEFEDFSVNVIEADTLDSTSVKIGKWKVVVKEKADGSDEVDFQIDRIDDEDFDFDFEDFGDNRSVDVFETDWLLFDLGYNNYVNKDFEFVVEAPYQSMEDIKTWGSWDVNLHMFRSRVNMFKGYVNLNWGLSWEWHNYQYRGNNVAVPRMDTFTLAESPTTLKKNRFSTTHLTLPVMLGFETKPWDPDKSFRMGFGYGLGLLVKGKTKIKSEEGTAKIKDNFNLQAPFRHELNFTMGYGDFNIYASYDVNSMFKEGQGPELYPVSIGLVIRRGFN